MESFGQPIAWWRRRRRALVMVAIAIREFYDAIIASPLECAVIILLLWFTCSERLDAWLSVLMTRGTIPRYGGNTTFVAMDGQLLNSGVSSQKQ